MPGPPVTIGCSVSLSPGAAGLPDLGVIQSIGQVSVTANGMPLAVTNATTCQMVNSVTGVPYVLPIGGGNGSAVKIGSNRLVRVGDQIPSGSGVLTIVGPPASAFINDATG